MTRGKMCVLFSCNEGGHRWDDFLLMREGDEWTLPYVDLLLEEKHSVALARLCNNKFAMGSLGRDLEVLLVFDEERTHEKIILTRQRVMRKFYPPRGHGSFPVKWTKRVDMNDIFPLSPWSIAIVNRPEMKSLFFPDTRAAAHR